MACALPGNPFDDHTLTDQITQTERITVLEVVKQFSSVCLPAAGV